MDNGSTYDSEIVSQIQHHNQRLARSNMSEQQAAQSMPSPPYSRTVSEDHSDHASIMSTGQDRGGPDPSIYHCKTSTQGLVDLTSTFGSIVGQPSNINPHDFLGANSLSVPNTPFEFRAYSPTLLQSHGTQATKMSLTPNVQVSAQPSYHTEDLSRICWKPEWTHLVTPPEDQELRASSPSGYLQSCDVRPSSRLSASRTTADLETARRLSTDTSSGSAKIGRPEKTARACLLVSHTAPIC